MNQFSLDFLYELLIDKRALIYHGLGIAKGVGSDATNALAPLSRLQKVIDENLEVSCSTVLPGDSEETTSYWGRIGLVLCPLGPESITLACWRDAGTLPDPNNYGRRIHPTITITEKILRDSIECRAPNSANEWCVLNYDVLGVLVEPPIQYLEGGVFETLEVERVFDVFPNQSVYCFKKGVLHEVNRAGTWGPIMHHCDLYAGLLGRSSAL